MSLMDIINKRKQSFATAPVSAEALTTQAVQARGKEATPQTGPAVSNIQAQLAAQAGQAQMAQQQLGQQTQLAGMAQQEQTQKTQFEQAQRAQAQQAAQTTQDLLAQETMRDQERQSQEDLFLSELDNRETLQTKKLTEGFANSLARLASDRGIAEQELFQYAKQKQAELGLDKHLSFIEQTAHAMALSDKKYTDEISRIGRTNRLSDDIEFKKEAQRIAFGNDLAALSAQFNMDALLNADMREYKAQIAELDLQTALKMSDMAMKESQYKSMITGAVNIGAGFLGDYMKNKPLDSTEIAQGVDYSAPSQNTGIFDTNSTTSQV